MFTQRKSTHEQSETKSLTEKIFTTFALIKRLPRAVRVVVAMVAVVALAGAGYLYWQQRKEARLQELVTQTLKENAKKVRFLENKGQLPDKEVLYYIESKQGAIYIESDQIRFVAKETESRTVESDIMPGGKKPLHKPDTESVAKSQHSFTLHLDDSNNSPTIRRGEEFGTRYNYFFGTDSKEWVTGVRATKELTLEDVYPGIDLRLYSTDDGSLEFDWVMDAGVDFSRVKMRFDGQDSLSVEKDGSLKVGLRFTDVKFHLPESYQVTDQGKAPVNIAFNQSSSNTIDFSTESAIDSRYPLVIDPTLTWGTFMDGNTANFDQYLFAIQVDPADGVVYCAGGSNQSIATGSDPYNANGYLNTVADLTSSGTPRVAIVYRISANGSDLMDLTLFGPSSSPGNTVAYGLSLSSTKVFIGGHTTVAIPAAGSQFDSTLDGSGDGFVAVFPRNLGTLDYSTYLGGTGTDFPGVTSIRALSDTSFAAGLTASAALPAAYITAGAPDTAFGTGAGEMYIAKFANLSNLTGGWGTYVGGDGVDTFNDLEVYADGKVAFAGKGTGELTEVSSAAARSTGSDTDGIIGVLNNTGTAFTYLDEIGGGNDDAINDVEITGSTLYWAGAASSGFPTSVGAYDTSHNGGTDVVVGSVSNTGTGYKATFYGTSGADQGNGLKLVTKTKCDGSVSSFVLAFGTVEGAGLPTTNINGEAFFDSSRPGGIDVFFGGFSGDLTALTYGTYIGGTANDYLGDTGAPRGGNHLWVNGTDIYCGTTTHSASHTPAITGGGGFDTGKSNGSDDVHVIFAIGVASLNELDYGDAIASFGSPSHVLDCTNLRIGALLDAETSHPASANADADDLANLDDEDGVASPPSVTIGGPQTISVTVGGLINSTGSSANLYSWIDLDSDGQFEAGEFQSTTVADGFSGSKTLTWTGATISGATPKPYLRVRLTTQNLTDTPGTAAVDERSTATASDGEVEDYLLTAIASTDLSISKTDGSATYTAGNAISYTIVVNNAGPSNSLNASVADTVPAAITGVTATCVASGTASCGTNASSGNNVSFTGVDINSGGSNFLTITVSGTVSASATGNLVNTTTVAAGSGQVDPTPANNTATDTDTPNPQTDLSVTKTDGSATYTAGNAISYTIVVNNAGPSNATAASVADTVPATITGVTATCVASGTASCGTNASSGNSVSFTGVNINSGGSNFLTITISGTVSASATGNLVNTVIVAAGSGQNDPTPANNTATDTDTPNPQTDLSVTKTDGSATYTAGNAISYTIAVNNAGPSNALNASVADTVPAAITGVTATCVASGTADCGTNASSGNSVSFTGVDINSGASNFLTITVSGTVSAGATGNLVNTVTVAAGSGQTDPTPANNSATDTDTPNAVTDLSITKTDGSATYTAGNAISYTIVVNNGGPSNALNASVADTVPAAITGVTATCVPSGTASCGTNGSSGNSVSFTGVNINSGGANFLTITVSGTVSASATGNLVNTATVTAATGQTDPTPGNNTATDTDTPNAVTDLSITKTDGSATYTPGNAISYTVVVSNAGPSNATGASVADTVPATITGVTATCVASGTASCGTNGSSGNSVSFTGVNINAGGANFLTITISGTVNASATGNLVNTATVTAGSGQTDPTPGNNSATDTDTINAVANLAITKDDGVTSVNANGTVTYSIVVSNAGPSSANGAIFTDPAATGLSATAVTCGSASGGAACPTAGNTTVALMQGAGIVIPTLPSGGSVTFMVTATVSATTGNVTNTATVAPPSGTTDPTPGNNTASDTDTVNPITDLAITKTDGSATYTAGNAISYTIVVNNAGPSNAIAASVADTVPAAITGVTATCVPSGTASCGTNGSSGNSVSFTGVNINSGGANFLTITVSGTVSASTTGNLVNTATVAAGSGQTDPTPGNNTATDTDTPNAVTDLSITKTDGSATYTAGNAISYTIVVNNAGPSNATGASIADAIPASITGTTISCVASGTATCGTNASAGNSLSFTGVNINAGASNFLTITVSGTVSASTTGNLVNTVSVTAGSGQTDPTPGNNTATDTDTPNAVTDLSVTKTDGSATYTAGNAISYTIVVNNAGPSNATGASIADTVPAAITGTTISCVASGTATCGTNASAGNNLSFTGVNINSGGANFLTITVSGTVSASTTGNLVNTVSVTAGSGQTDPTPGNNTATDTDTPNAVTDLSITKTDGSATYTAGNAISYTIVVNNAGPSNATGASIADAIPASITGTTISCVASGTATCGTNASAGNSLSFTGVNINAGASNFLTITVSGTVSASTTGNLVNTVSVTAGSGQTDPTPGNNTATDTDTPNAVTDLSVTKTDGSATYTAGNAISYTIVVNNAGPSNATGASIADTVPAAITGTTISCVASGTATCGTNASAGNNLSFTGVNINSGGANFLTITVSGTVSASTTGNLVNTVSVTAGSGQTDPTPGNNTATDTDTPNAVTDLSITKTDGSATYTAGNAISYTIVVNNAGPSNATGASIADAIPASITGTTISCVASGTATCGTNASAGNNLSFTGVNINSGGANFLTITVSGTVSASTTGNLVNTVSVTAGSGQTDPTPGNNTATDTDTPNAVTDLSVTKTDGSATYTAGNAISYTIVVNNAGPSNATGASIADTVPAAITGTTISCVASGTATCGTNASAGNNLSFTGVNINSGGANFLTITVSGTVSASTTGNLVNTVSVTAGSGQTDPTPGNNTATDTDTPNAVTDLSITKTDGSATYTAGNAISYTIVVNNAGPSNATGASIADAIPASITGTTISCVASGTATCGTNASAGNNLSFTGVNINSGGANFLTITVSGTVSASTTGNLVNTVSVTAGSGQTDPTPGNNTATDTDTPNAVTDLSITKTDGSATYTAGNAISYTIVVNNAGPSNATGASIADAIPASITGTTISCVASGTATCGTNASAGNSLSFTGVNINAGGANFLTITVSGTVSAGATGNLVNTATVAAGSGQTDPTPGNNSATDTDTPNAVTDLSVTKTDGSATYTAGNAISYTIVVNNAGPSNATGASIADTVPAAITGTTISCVASGTATCGTNASAGNNLSFTGVNINSGGANFLTITVSGTVSASTTGNLVNTVSVTAGSGQTDPTPGNNTATDTDTPNAVTDLSITKTDGSATYTAGNAISYTIVVNNAGPSNATGASIADAIPASITGTTISCVASGTATCGTNASAGNNLSFTGVNINSGGANFLTITVSGTVSASTTGNLVNTVSVTAGSGQTDPTPGNNTATDTDTPNAVTDLSITKTDGSATYTAGNAISYTIVVNNAGPSNATGASIADAIPASITGTTISCVASGTATCGTNASAGNSLSFTGVNINAGASNFLTITVSGTVDSATTGDLVNTATVTAGAGQTDPTPGNNTATDTDTPNPIADLAVTKTDGVTTVVPGTATTYTIVVTNNGPSNVIGGTVTDNLPTPITSWTWVCSGATGGATGCDGVVNSATNFTDTVNLPSGATITYTVTANINQAATGNLVNTVTVAVPQGTTDPTPGNNTATDTDTLTPIADLAVQKNGAAMIAPNGSITYTIRVSNAGPSSANGAAVTDTLPGVLAGVTWTCGAETGGAVCGTTAGNGDINTAIQTFPSGGSVTFTVMATGPASGTFVNTANVAPPQGVTDPNSTNNTSSVSTGVGLVPTTADLAVVKSGPSTALPNGAITYNILVTNAGPGAANGAIFTDTPPLTGVTWTCGNETAGASCGTVAGSGNINTTIATLPAGGSVTFMVTGTGSASGTMVNTATIAPPPGVTDPNSTNNTSTVSTVVLGQGEIPIQADLYSIKTGPATVAPNANVVYTVIVGNSGPAGVTNAVFTDNVPSVLTSVTWTCGSPTGGASCGTANGSGNTISTTVANLPANSTVTYTITGTAPSSGTFVNSSNITPPVGTIDPDPTDNIGGPVITNIIVVADLAITKTDGTATYTPGTSTTYTIVVTNNGPDAVTGALVTDNIPPQVTSWTWVCGGATGGATGCDGAASNSANFSDTVNMPSGSTITYTVTAQTSSAATGNLVNTATVAVPTGVTDPTPGNNTATDTDTPTPMADLAVTKTDGTGTYTPGIGTTYTIVVTNNGPSNVTGATVADSIPSQVTSWAWACAGATGGATGCDGAASNSANFSDTVNLPAGATITYTVTAQIPASATGNLVNTVTVAVPQGVTDPTPGNNTATDTDTPNPIADLAVTKTDGSAIYVPGGSTTYTIVVSNAGPSNVIGGLVVDNIPSQISSWTWVCSGATGGATGCDGAASSAVNFSDTVNLPVGATITYTVTAQTPPSATGNLVNTVTVTPPQGTTDPTPGNNTATDTDTPQPQADLSLTKTVNNPVPMVGGTVVFTITLRNAGPSVATGVVVRDLLPAGLAFVSAVPSQGSYNSATGIWAVGTVNPNATATLLMTVVVHDPSAINIAEVSGSDVPDPDSTPGNGNPGEDDIGRVEFSTDKGPGRPISPFSEASDDKAGSVLIYNYYTSSATSSNIENTRFNITNTSPSMDITVHLFFVDGATCAVADNYLCLTANQTSSFLAADLDPGVSGYLVAMAVDQNGCPINANCLIGDEYVKTASGHSGNVGAVAISALKVNPAACDSASVTGTLSFDGVNYNRLPRVVSLDSVGSRADGNDTLFVLNRIGGNLGIGAATLGSLFGILYNDTEDAYSFTVSGGCQIRSVLSNNFPRTAPRFEQVVPAGRTGWMKLWSAADNGILGSAFNTNPDKAISSKAYVGAHNLHSMTLTSNASYIVPVFPPRC